MRILIPLHGFVGWNGGLDFIRLLTAGLDCISSQASVEVHFAFPELSLPVRLKRAIVRCLHMMHLRSQPLPASVASRSLARTIKDFLRDRPVHRCGPRGADLAKLAEAIKADAIFPSMLPVPQSSRFVRIGYIHDFQHRHLPHFFSADELASRDRNFRTLTGMSDAIVVNSKTVARDATEFLGIPAERILALPFSPYATKDAFAVEPRAVRARYGVSERYFMISNHFWTHKDHATALMAFERFGKRPGNTDIELVLTGDTVDYRDRDSFSRLEALATNLRITSRLHVLGLVPKSDQLALMRGSMALIQPTLYEGGPGGGSVYDAVGLGVPVLLSDIPINREVDVGKLVFFQARNPNSLLEAMQLIDPDHGNRPNQSELLRAANSSLERLGNSIFDFLDSLATRILAGHETAQHLD